ncbi:Metallophos domain-containing protein [Meloidogyne graminicola]|uniref:Metallophos domain-containing protein n=1 Tax=Meloidogyne graminicola TaxID=189291 RepID=A0A8S9ZKQ1_9BILA|nr:Metallophos domain-containing protein [Meloidogyne graminicola]
MSSSSHRSKPKIIYDKQWHMTIPKFKLLVKKLFIFHATLIIGICEIKLVGNFCANRLTGYRQGNLRRFASIIALEWAMLHFDLPIYLHLFSVFDLKSSILRSKNERLRIFCLIGFALLLLMAHLTYLFYVIESFEINSFIYDLSAISNGIWIHLCLFCYFFMVYNIGMRMLSVFVFGRKVLDKLFSFPFIKFITLNKKFQVGLTLILTALLSFSHWYSSDKLIIRHQKIQLSRPTSTRQNLKVAVLTDLHAGAAVYAEQIAKAVESVNKITDLDAVFLIGDIIDAPRDLIEERVESLRHLRSQFGTFYVTGNHEYYYGNVNEWFELFDSYEIVILKNRIHNHEMDVNSIKSCPLNETTIVLEHNPSATKQILAFSDKFSHPVDLILSGHTHAGQFLIVAPIARLFLPYFYGLYQLNNGVTQLLVSAGTLFQNAPMKTPFMSEIWILEIITLNK